jgi:hypothetical protein
MTNKERFLSSVNHKEPDGVALCMDAEKEVWPRLAAALGVKTKEDCYRALDIDEWMVDPNVVDPRRKRLSPEEEVIQWGYHVKQIKTEFGSYGDICEWPLKDAQTIEDLERYNWPDPKLINFDHWPVKRREMGERAIIGHITHGPYFNCTFIRGMEAFLMDMAMNPEFAKRMMDFAEHYIQGAIDNMLSVPANRPDVYYIADDFCQAGGRSLISSLMIRRTARS